MNNLIMSKKRCVHCKKMKDEQEFSWSNKSKGVRNKRCKECQKVFSKNHYNKNKEVYLNTQRKIRDRNQEFVCNYLKDKCCVDCGEDDIVVLQFDHIDPTKKERYEDTISHAMRDKWGIERIKKEMKKCEIRCANCHIKRHAREIGSYKYLFGNVV